MMSRIRFLAVSAVALVTLAGLPLFAADAKVHEVTVVKAAEGKITLTMHGDVQQHTHDVAKDATITLDNKAAKLEELKEGFHAQVSMDDKSVVSKIIAKSLKK